MLREAVGPGLRERLQSLLDGVLDTGTLRVVQVEDVDAV